MAYNQCPSGLERGTNQFVALGSPTQHELQQLTSQVQLFTQAVLIT
jgi:hypothetical protein